MDRERRASLPFARMRTNHAETVAIDLTESPKLRNGLGALE